MISVYYNQGVIHYLKYCLCLIWGRNEDLL